jgi:hypothetical protein
MKKRQLILALILICTLIGLVIIVGCVSTNTKVPTILPDTSSPSPTNLLVATATKIPIVNITNTVTSTATKPVVASATNIPTKLPTLSPDDAALRILELIKDNGGCKLPCIWGVNPLSSTLQSVISFTEQFENGSKPGEYDISNSGDVTAIFWKGNLRAYTNFGPSARKGNLAYLNLYAEFTQEQGEGVNLNIKPVFGNPYFSQLFGNLFLPKILSEYGTPSQVMILPFYDDPDAPKDFNSLFSLVLVYQEKGFLIEYLFPKEKGTSDYIGCPSKAAYLSLITWAPKNQPTLEDAVRGNSGLGINSHNLAQFKSLEEATTMTSDSFIHTFSKEKSRDCIETPQNLWKIP